MNPRHDQEAQEYKDRSGPFASKFCYLAALSGPSVQKLIQGLKDIKQGAIVDAWFHADALLREWEGKE